MGAGGRKPRIALVAFLAAVSLGLGTASAAGAATVIGQTGTPGNVIVPGKTMLQSTLASGAGYTAPAGGVITSWSSTANATANRTQKLLVMRLASGNTFSVIQRDVLRTLALVNQLNTFSGIRIPIEAGDRIGLYVPATQPGNASSGAFGTGDLGDVIKNNVGAEPGSSVLLDAPQNANNRVNVSAVIEPDADKDGFGDETQDKCPSSGTTQGACPAKKAKKCKKAKKQGKAAAKKRCKKRKKK